MVEQSFHVTDSTMLRAFAHPLRQRIMWELAVRTHARAADLARYLDEPANSVSFHLRTLAKAGLVIEAPEHARDGRDRVWAMAHQEGFYFEPGELASQLYVREQLAWVEGVLNETLPRDERATRGMYNGAALLTRAESKQMFEELTEILEKWRQHGALEAERNPDDESRVFHNLMLLVGNRADGASSAAPGSESASEPGGIELTGSVVSGPEASPGPGSVGL